DMAAACRNDTRGHGTAKAVGIADSDHPIANTRLPVCKLYVRKIAAAIHLEQCQVCSQICTDHPGGIGLAVLGGYLERYTMLDDMIVRHGVSVRRYEKA